MSTSTIHIYTIAAFSILPHEYKSGNPLNSFRGAQGDGETTSHHYHPYHCSSKVMNRHCNFSRETGKREICRREISHGKIRREKREIVKSKIRVFWPKLK